MVKTRLVTLFVVCKSCNTEAHIMFLKNTRNDKCDKCGKIYQFVAYKEHE